MSDRTIEPKLKELSKKYPVVTVTGPRQSGKTTLCRKVFPKKDGMFILTGSQQFEVSCGTNQSLAGRTALLKLLLFSIEELSGHYDVSSINRMVLTGFYPRIYDKDLNPTTALGDYFET